MDKKKLNVQFLSTIQDLMLFLGGEKNILKIDNCLSRIRITLSNINICADDQLFLNLNASGIVRSGQEIHLIFGPQSALIKQNLEIFKEILEDHGIILLLQVLQGPDNIKNIEIINNMLAFQLHNTENIITPYSNNLFTLKTQENNTIVISWNDHHIPAQNIFERLLSAINFWDFIIAQKIYTILDKEKIVSIQNNSSEVLIEIQNFEIIPLDHLKNIGLSIKTHPEERIISIIYARTINLKEILIKIINSFKI